MVGPGPDRMYHLISLTLGEQQSAISSEPRRTQSEPGWNRFQSFAQLDIRFSSLNDRTPARTHSEAADEGPLPMTQDQHPDEPETDGFSPKRCRYYDPSNVSLSEFTGFGCLDVAKWIRNYSNKCQAQQVNRLGLLCQEPTYYRMMDHPL